MKEQKQMSLIFPYDDSVYRHMTDTACHDVGLDSLCKELSDDPKEQKLIMDVISSMTADIRVSEYRQAVFGDFLALPDMCRRMTELFDKLEYLRGYASLKRSSDERLGILYLLHRLSELNEYITCVEEMNDCLTKSDIHSEGLCRFRDLIASLYEEQSFSEMKKDIYALKEKTADIRSVTVGINLTDTFEAESLGLISINKKPFRKSGVVSNFADSVANKNGIKDTTEWNGDMHYHQADSNSNFSVSSITDILEVGHRHNIANMQMLAMARHISKDTTTVNVPEGDGMRRSTFYLENITNKLLNHLVKKLSETLTKYVDTAVLNISGFIPEFIYYIRFAEFVNRCRDRGMLFCTPAPCDDNDTSMDTRGFYNLKLAVNTEHIKDIVTNDLVFDKNNSIYILTGANRGGKTTVTQAIGLLFVLAQAGITVPADMFRYHPVDCIYTHFPADEDKTMDLGRLGEECVRFKEIFSSCTEDSLLLLNETFSTTSFEEGYYIARDSVKALLSKHCRVIYNTHMHKLAADAQLLTDESGIAGVSSLVMQNEGGKRSFRLKAAAPEGMSYARDIAEKYGVTYEMLMSSGKE
ncbi:MAG: DNA mismatch repair protein [Oscillospiraceae bacterium]|nr:DNA mismatch repair protein [Oscillospiraceae bacterium]